MQSSRNGAVASLANVSHQQSLQLLTDEGLAELLQVSRRQIWKLLARGVLPEPTRLGRSVRWRASDIEAWIANGCRIDADGKTVAK